MDIRLVLKENLHKNQQHRPMNIPIPTDLINPNNQPVTNKKWPKSI